MATRYLYLARHGQALPDGTGLTARGREQALLLGRRLRDSPVSVVHHGPLPRATETARLIGEQLDRVPLHATELVGDYPPQVPSAPSAPPAGFPWSAVLGQYSTEERERGPALAAAAVRRFTGPVEGHEESHELVVTHAFLVSWLVRHAMDAPEWRWVGLNPDNAALTVIRYSPGRVSSLLFYNDMSHLPAAALG